MNEKEEHKIQDDLQEKPQIFLSKSVQEELRNLIPEVSSEEIMACEMPEAKAADKLILWKENTFLCKGIKPKGISH